MLCIIAFTGNIMRFVIRDPKKAKTGSCLNLLNSDGRKGDPFGLKLSANWSGEAGRSIGG